MRPWPPEPRHAHPLHRLATMHPRYRRLVIPCALVALLLIVVIAQILRH